MRFPKPIVRSLLLALVVVAVPGAALAQRAAGLRIVARENGSTVPVPGAQVLISGFGTVAVSDTAGVAYSPSVPLGQRLVQVQRFGYQPEYFTVEFRLDETVEAEVDLLRAPIQLERVTVTAERPVRTLQGNGFYTRRQAGIGDFLDRKQIEALRPDRVSTLFRTIPGVQLVYCKYPDCKDPGYYLVASSRGVQTGAGMSCFMHVYVDGVPLGPVTPDRWIPDNIEAVEVYRRAVELPGQFYTQTAAYCGVVAMWTRSGG